MTSLKVLALLSTAPFLLAQAGTENPARAQVVIVKRGISNLSSRLHLSAPVMETASRRLMSDGGEFTSDELDVATFSHLIAQNRETDSGVQRILGERHILTLSGSEGYIEPRSGAEPTRWFAVASLWEELLDSSVRVDHLWLTRDPGSNRWAITAAADSETSGSAILLAVSENSDPAGAWRVYRMAAAGGKSFRPGTTTVQFGEDSLALNTTWLGTDRTGRYSIGASELGSAGAQASAGVAVAAATPQPLAVSPNAGAGASAQFSATYSRSAAPISRASLLFNSTLSAVNACWVLYDAVGNQLGLVDDSGVGVSYLTGGVTMIQNSQCILNATGSSAFLGPGATLVTIQANLAFKPAFGGTKAIYMSIADTNGLNSDWQVKGDWTVPTASLAPSVDGVAPSFGSGVSQIFAGSYSDLNGASAITQAYMLFNSSLSGNNACWVYYDGATGRLGLVADNGSGISYVALGTSNTVQNSQCILSGNGSGATLAGDTLTVYANLTFTPAFGGIKTIYLNANAGSLNSGWQAQGFWTVPTGNVAPETLLVSPNSGEGLNQQFIALYSDGNGATAITQAYLLLNAGLSGVNACWVFYNGNPSQLGLVSDNGTVINYVTLGTAGTAQNSQCTLNGLGSYVNISQNTLTLAPNLTFKPAFGGTKTIYMNANAGALNSGWQAKGNWTVPTTAIAPRPISLFPNSGTVANSQFQANYRDVNGATAITQAYILINTTLSGVNACWVYYDGASNQLGLVSDNGLVVNYVPLDAVSTVQNSQCILNASGSSITRSGDSLTIFANLSFKPAFTSSKTIYLDANAGSLYSGWQLFGTWTVP